MYELQKSHKQLPATVINVLVKDIAYATETLPYGKAFTGQRLFNNLTKLFQRKTEESQSLSQLGNSKGNESLNQIISTKAPEWKHFGGSSSLNFQVTSGIPQKNVGRKYLLESTMLTLSRSRHYMEKNVLNSTSYLRRN
ncbi:uncharacterized protein LOC128549810 [Mercenaria mercenaria]|uniref:uncharacterized protein LOC128549810 n=1 Tax=Mercenaria mercenaria TaxID=6596 RepID=UPI00234F8606|nr:uncharacterized protein LOC128549810 [Mercenaria mercenaria]